MALLVAVLLPCILGQSDTDGPFTFESVNSLCNKTFADANMVNGDGWNLLPGQKLIGADRCLLIRS